MANFDPQLIRSLTNTTLDFAQWSGRVCQITEQGLERWLPPPTGACARLHEAMRYAVLGGGKRIRPLCVFATGILVDGDILSLVRAAVAVEIIHTYSLVHDDLPSMDNDDLRRGRPTVHRVWDEATALLVGDALQSQAFLILSGSTPNEKPSDPINTLLQITTLAGAIGSEGMCGGQQIDWDMVGQKTSREVLEDMHNRKTGALLRASLILGLLCTPSHSPSVGGHDSNTLSMSSATTSSDTGVELAISRYAQALGLLFQVKDDILDATQSSAVLGKTAGKDQRDSKPTFVSILGLSHALKIAEELYQETQDSLSGIGDGGRRLRELSTFVYERQY